MVQAHGLVVMRVYLHQLVAQLDQVVIVAAEVLDLFEELLCAHRRRRVLLLQLAHRHGRVVVAPWRCLRELQLSSQLRLLCLVTHVGLAQLGARLVAGSLERDAQPLRVPTLLFRCAARACHLAVQLLDLLAPRRLSLLDELKAHVLEIVAREHIAGELALRLIELRRPLRARLHVLLPGLRELVRIRLRLLAELEHLTLEDVGMLAEAIALLRRLAQRRVHVGRVGRVGLHRASLPGVAYLHLLADGRANGERRRVIKTHEKPGAFAANN